MKVFYKRSYWSRRKKCKWAHKAVKGLGAIAVWKHLETSGSCHFDLASHWQNEDYWEMRFLWLFQAATECACMSSQVGKCLVTHALRPTDVVERSWADIQEEGTPPTRPALCRTFRSIIKPAVQGTFDHTAKCDALVEIMDAGIWKQRRNH